MSKAPSKPAVPDAEFGVLNPIIFDKVEYLALDLIKIRPGNPRKHDDKNIDAIARAVVATRVMVPLVIALGNVVVTGEGRYAAAKRLMLSTVPVLRAEDLTEEEFIALRIADNRVPELSKWDEPDLAVALKMLSTRDLSFNIEHIGFPNAAIDIKISSLDEAVDPANDPADVVPEIRTTAISRIGDVWLCGKHRIICGSALELSVYAALMRGGKAQMSIQDAPYNVSVTKHVGGLGATRHREFAMATGEMSSGEFSTFLSDELKLTAEHCDPGAVIMAFMDWRSIDKLIVGGKANGLELINLCVWNKTNASMGSLYRSKHELVAVFKKPGARHRNNVQLGSYGRYRTNVWDAAGCNSFGKNRMEELESHPTVKPVELIADAIRDVSNRGEVILDSFAGSGTTMIAADRTGRIAYCIELDPLYVDTTVRRWEQFTGAEAVLESTGRTFADTAASASDNTPLQVSPRARMRVMPADA